MNVSDKPLNQNQAPLVSFIITYYNLPVDMLHECIESIMQLSLQPEEREIILIDDGSDITPLNEI
ncbi:MAG: glycosyltransferase, partial [Prevotella sp.]|nr:glycosyltransferase [Prevotella sp.]